MEAAEQVDLLATPFEGEEPAGQDPRSTEEFEAIGNELAKIGGVDLVPVDWGAVVRDSAHLLTEHGKDLRLAVYWTIGSMSVDGPAMLSVGVSLFSRLLENFGKDVHPRRKRARGSILSWFAERTEIELKGGGFTLTKDERHELLGGLEACIAAIDTLEVDSAPIRRIQSAIGEHASVKLSADEAQAKVRARFDPEFADIAVQVIEHESIAQHTPRGLRLHRWALWDTVPSFADRTLDVTIDREPEAVLREHLANSSWKELLEVSEAAFSSTPFWIDLTFFSARAAQQLYDRDAALGLIGTLRDLLARAPELQHALDSEGTPVASEDTLQWIDDEVSDSREAKAADVEELPSEVRELMDDGRLKEALAAASIWIAHPDGRVRFARSVTLANAFGAKGSANNAHVVFRGLHNHLRQMTVKDWDPPLFTACITGYLSTKRDAFGLGPEDDMLLDELSALDPAALMSILPP